MIIVTVPRIVVLVAAIFVLGRVAGCSASRPYGAPGVALHVFLNTPVSE